MSDLQRLIGMQGMATSTHLQGRAYAMANQAAMQAAAPSHVPETPNAEALGTMPELKDPAQQFVVRNLIQAAQAELAENAQRAALAQRELAAERANRMTAEAERDALRLQLKVHRPEFIRALLGPPAPARIGPQLVPNNLWLATSIALIVVGVAVML